MNDMICRNNGAEIYELIDEITNMLAQMTQTERLEWFVLVKLFGNTLFGNYAPYRTSIGVI
jgi:hypothetical protein